MSGDESSVSELGDPNALQETEVLASPNDASSRPPTHGRSMTQDMADMSEALAKMTRTNSFGENTTSPSTPTRTKRAVLPQPATFTIVEEPHPGEVSDWLRSIGYGKYTKDFHEEEFNTLSAVSDITEDDLKHMNITKRGAIRGLLKNIREIKTKADTSAALRAMLPALKQLEERMQQLEEQYELVDQLNTRVDRLAGMFGELPQRSDLRDSEARIAKAAEGTAEELQSQIAELREKLDAVIAKAPPSAPPRQVVDLTNDRPGWAYVAADGSTIRNQTADALREAARLGKMKKGNYVWQKGFEAWMPISKVPQLNYEDDHNPYSTYTGRI